MSSRPPATGTATRPSPGRARARAKDPDEAAAPAGGRLEIPLEHMRNRHLAWMGFGIVLGGLLVWKLGTVGQWIGVILLGIGALATYGFVRTLLYPSGTIVVSDSGVELPRGLCKGDPVRVALASVRHAYLLRRAVPWTRAAPVLVVEADGRAFTYPRDWFLTEADQRRIVRELTARGAAAAAAPAPAATRTKEATDEQA